MKNKVFLQNDFILQRAHEFVTQNAVELQALTHQPLLYGVPRGGIPVLYAVHAACRAHGYAVGLTADPKEADFIVDDIVDSGATMRRMLEINPKAKTWSVIDVTNRSPEAWYVFPWETAEEDKSAHDIVTRMMQYIGEDVDREGLLETPKRVLKAWDHWFSGYGKKPEDVFKVFTDGAEGVDELVTVHNIPVFSHCEHHITPIVGLAHVGYIPDKRIVGISKLARLVDVFGRRLQVQERLTTQIANAIVENLKPKGVGVIIRARHLCMASRGACVPSSVTSTSAMRGVLLSTPSARAEFMQLCEAAEKDKQWF